MQSERTWRQHHLGQTDEHWDHVGKYWTHAFFWNESIVFWNGPLYVSSRVQYSLTIPIQLINNNEYLYSTFLWNNLLWLTDHYQYHEICSLNSKAIASEFKEQSWRNVSSIAYMIHVTSSNFRPIPRIRCHFTLL